MLNLTNVGRGPGNAPVERPLAPKELDGIVRAWDREAAEDEARGKDPALRGAGRHVLMARRGVMFHGPCRTPGPTPSLGPTPTGKAPLAKAETLDLPPPPPPPPPPPRARAHDNTAESLALRAAVTTSPPVRDAADRLVDCLTQPTGLKGLWRRLLTKERPVSLHKQASRLVDAVHQSVMRHRRATTPVSFEEGKILHELVREGFQRLDVPAQTRWRDRVSGGAGEFPRARRAQTSTVNGLLVNPRAGSPYQQACSAGDLLFDMKAVARGPVVARPPVAPPPKPPRLRPPEGLAQDEKQTLLTPHVHAIGQLKATIAVRPHWTDRLPWRSAKVEIARQNEISTLTREIGTSMVEALMRRGKSADAACLLVESWCAEQFEAVYHASDPRERQQWARNVAGKASGAFAAARRECLQTMPATGYQQGDIRPGKAADVATGYVMSALERAAARGRGAAIAA